MFLFEAIIKLHVENYTPQPPSLSLSLILIYRKYTCISHETDAIYKYKYNIKKKKTRSQGVAIRVISLYEEED